MELHRDPHSNVGEKNTRRRLILACLVMVALGLPAAILFPGWLARVQEVRLLRQGKNAARSDAVRAVICLRRVLAMNPRNLDAARTLAEIAEQHAPAEAVGLRQRVSLLAPGSEADARAWLLAALRVNRPSEAQAALEAWQKTGAKSAEFLALGGEVALASGDWAVARERLQQALELEPGLSSARLNLAAVDLLRGPPDARHAAREVLHELRARPQYFHAATRALVADAMERAELGEARELATRFIDDPEATFSDRLKYLAILRAIESPSGSFVSAFQREADLSLGPQAQEMAPSFAAYLNELQERARQIPGDAAALVDFLNQTRLSLLACGWAESLDSSNFRKPPVAIALADSYRLTLAWEKLEKLCADAEWGIDDFRRVAFLSLAQRELHNLAASHVSWNLALRLADYRADKLMVLERMTANWGWVEEWEEVVWTLARSAMRPREALLALAELYAVRRDTQKLFTVWSRLRELDPQDFEARKNWARISLLLDNDKLGTATLLQQLYKEAPDDPQIACSYALLQRNRLLVDDAIAVMERLPLEVRRTPPVAAYYGVILFAKNRKPEAAEYIARAKGAALLREEQALVDKVRRTLD